MTESTDTKIKSEQRKMRHSKKKTNMRWQQTRLGARFEVFIHISWWFKELRNSKVSKDLKNLFKNSKLIRKNSPLPVIKLLKLKIMFFHIFLFYFYISAGILSAQCCICFLGDAEVWNSNAHKGSWVKGLVPRWYLVEP